MHGLLQTVCLIGFAALALAMPRHQVELRGRALSRSTGRTLRGVGALALALAWGLAWRHWGGGLGSVAFAAHAMLAAGGVYLGLMVLRRARR